MYKVTAVFLLGLFALTCGFLTEKEAKTSRIVGGTDASPDDAPYQVSLRVKSSNNHMCGGVLITTRTVVTATHCILGFAPSDLQVVVGTILLNSGGDYYDVVSRITHPKFNKLWGTNDIGILITATDVVLGPTVSLIPMGKSTVEEGVPAMMTGWGATSDPRSLPNHLQKLNTSTISFFDCKRALFTAVRLRVLRSNICVLSGKGAGVCKGDSGGPLVADGELIGIYSWGDCGQGYPDVFARVSSYHDWIVGNSV